MLDVPLLVIILCPHLLLFLRFELFIVFFDAHGTVIAFVSSGQHLFWHGPVFLPDCELLNPIIMDPVDLQQEVCFHLSFGHQVVLPSEIVGKLRRQIDPYLHGDCLQFVPVLVPGILHHLLLCMHCMVAPNNREPPTFWQNVFVLNEFNIAVVLLYGSI